MKTSDEDPTVKLRTDLGLPNLRSQQAAGQERSRSCQLYKLPECHATNINNPVPIAVLKDGETKTKVGG